VQPEGEGIPEGFGGGPLALKRIDHVLQLAGSPEAGHICATLPAEEVLQGLQHVVDIITAGKACPPRKDGLVPIWEAPMTPEECFAFLSDPGPMPGTPPESRSPTPSTTPRPAPTRVLPAPREASPPKPSSWASIANPALEFDGCPLGDPALAVVRTPSMIVANQAQVTRELARAALNRPEVKSSPSPETEAVNWLLHKDINRIASLISAESSPLTSPGPFRQSPFHSPWSSPTGSAAGTPSESPAGSPGLQPTQSGSSPGGSPTLTARPAPVDTRTDKVKRQFALDISTPT